MNKAQELTRFLDLEQSLILARDFEGLEQLMSKKEALAEMLAGSAHEISQRDAKTLQEASLRNDALLRSTQRGLLAAKRQIADVIGGDQTYGCDGGRTKLVPQRSVEKKL